MRTALHLKFAQKVHFDKLMPQWWLQWNNDVQTVAVQVHKYDMVFIPLDMHWTEKKNEEYHILL